MTPNALGTWRKPPLAYVVAELAISPYYNLAERIPALQDRLRAEYPRTIEGKHLLVVDPSRPPAVQPVWQLLAADQRHGILIGTQAFALHATAYVDSAEFLARWRRLLDAVEGLAPFVERAGLRYIDLIVPSQVGQEATDYLAPALRGINPEGARTTGAMWAAAFKYDGSLVNLRTGAPAPTGIVLPPDFNALPLQKPAVMVEAERHIKVGRSIGFIDTDCLHEIKQVLDASLIASTYTEMQKLASKTFRASISDLAKREWL